MRFDVDDTAFGLAWRLRHRRPRHRPDDRRQRRQRHRAAARATSARDGVGANLAGIDAGFATPRPETPPMR
jgi:hypothetical protein